jgi:hypothetical protein
VIGLRAGVTAFALFGLVAVIATGASAAGAGHDDWDRRILMLDDCDKSDPAWNAVGGCTKRGTVTVAEFDEELDSPLAAAVIGHQSWRNDPAYLIVKKGADLKIKNKGGRPHTFTEVAEFGGGIVPPLNEGLMPSPECPNPIVVPPGGKTKIENLTVGNHRFLCCFHPWRRTLVKVKPKRHGKHDD